MSKCIEFQGYCRKSKQNVVFSGLIEEFPHPSWKEGMSILLPEISSCSCTPPCEVSKFCECAGLEDHLIQTK